MRWNDERLIYTNEIMCNPYSSAYIPRLALLQPLT